MNKFCMLSLLALSLTLSVFGQSVLTKIENGKAYLAPGSIYVGAERIYLHGDEGLIPISAVHSDSEGLYLLEEDLVGKKWYTSWTCRCGEINGEKDERCWNCGRPR